MAIILGCDPSTKKIALVATDTVLHVVRTESYVLQSGKGKQTPESIAKAMDAMEDFLGSIEGLHGERFAYVEEPLVGRGGVSTSVKQAYVGGVIRACLVRADFTVYGVHPSTWRSTLGIKARGTQAIKNSTRLVVKQQWPKAAVMVGTDVDLIDAAAICLHGRRQYDVAAHLQGDAIITGSEVRRKKPRPVLR